MNKQYTALYTVHVKLPYLTKPFSYNIQTKLFTKLVLYALRALYFAPIIKK